MNNILNLIAQIIYDKKGFNIIALDVREISSVTDYFIIAEGNVDKHLRVLSKEINQGLKEHGQQSFCIEGMGDGDWVVLDYLDVIIHLLTPDQREKYSLEELWRDSKVVELNIDTSKKI
jgi:ribosome-associated protein